MYFSFHPNRFFRKIFEKRFGLKKFGRKIFAETKRVAEKAAERLCCVSRINSNKKYIKKRLNNAAERPNRAAEWPNSAAERPNAVGMYWISPL